MRFIIIEYYCILDFQLSERINLLELQATRALPPRHFLRDGAKQQNNHRAIDRSAAERAREASTSRGRCNDNGTMGISGGGGGGEGRGLAARAKGNYVPRWRHMLSLSKEPRAREDRRIRDAHVNKIAI